MLSKISNPTKELSEKNITKVKKIKKGNIYSVILNSMIVFFSSKSNKIFKKNFSKININYSYLLNFLYTLDIIEYFNNDEYYLIHKLFYSSGFNSGMLLYQIKLKHKSRFTLPNFRYKTKNILSSSTKFFGVEYLFHNKLKKNIKIQESFNDFKLFSIYVRIINSYTIVKIENIWYIFDENIGYTIIPFTKSENFIIFKPIQLNKLNFSFDKIEECIIFYLRDGSRIPQRNFIKEINRLKFLLKPIKYKDDFENIECDCNKNFGWQQYSSPGCPGICWFDSGMLAIFIPMKLRKIFLKPVSEHFNIPQGYLFPCAELYNRSYKKQFIKDLVNFNVAEGGNHFYRIITVFFSILDDIKNIPIYEQLSYNTFAHIFFLKKDRYKGNNKFKFNKIIYLKDFNLKYNFFIISQSGYFRPPKENLFGFQLQSIVLGFSFGEDYEDLHAASFIKCKQGWFFYDDNLALDDQNMIKLKYSIKDGYLIFKPIKYRYISFYDYDVYYNIDLDISKTYDRVYIYAK